MWPRWIRLSALFVGACYVSLSALGCGSTDSTAPPTEHINSTKPNADARVTAHTVFGDADKTTSIFHLKPTSAGPYAFRGRYNSSAGVGILGTGGAMSWFQPITYELRDVEPLTATGIVPRGVIAVGWKTEGTTEVGYATLYSSTGTALSQITFAADSTDMWLWAVKPVTDSSFVAVGGVRKAGVTHPLVVQINLKSPGFIERGRVVAVQDRTGWYSQVVRMPSALDQVALAAVSIDGTVQSMNGLHAPWPGLDAVTTDWSLAIVPTTGPGIDINNLVESGGNLYIAASVDDNRKGTPTGGTYWSSAYAASFTSAGAPRWATTVSLTKVSERFYRVAIGPDGVYGVGTASGYIYSTESKEIFGYGLISKLDLNDGHVIENFTIGDERFQSGFNTAIVTGGSLVCGGWTNCDTSDGPYQGWFATVNVSPLVFPSATTIAPAPPTAIPDRRGAMDPALQRNRMPR